MRIWTAWMFTCIVMGQRPDYKIILSSLSLSLSLSLVFLSPPPFSTCYLDWLLVCVCVGGGGGGCVCVGMGMCVHVAVWLSVVWLLLIVIFISACDIWTLVLILLSALHAKNYFYITGLYFASIVALLLSLFHPTHVLQALLTAPNGSRYDASRLVPNKGQY